MAILRSKEIWDMEVDEIQDKLVELRTELSKNVLYLLFSDVLVQAIRKQKSDCHKHYLKYIW